jgi:rare lipoprotein A
LRPSPGRLAAASARPLSLVTTRTRTALVACVLSLITIVAAAAVPAAYADTTGTAPTASIATVAIGWKHLDVRAGQRVVLAGRALPARAGVRALLQVRDGSRWRTLDRARTGARGRYRLRRRLDRVMSARARVVLHLGRRRLRRRIGWINVYRTAIASWYGPGLYGNRLACGGRLGYGTLGVANKSLPCGTRLTLRHNGRVVRVPVVDRGPYVAGREFDLTAATARRLHFGGHGAILVTR